MIHDKTIILSEIYPTYNLTKKIVNFIFFFLRKLDCTYQNHKLSLKILFILDFGPPNIINLKN